MIKNNKVIRHGARQSVTLKHVPCNMITQDIPDDISLIQTVGGKGEG